MNTISHRPISPVSTRRFDGTVGLTTLIIAGFLCLHDTHLPLKYAHTKIFGLGTNAHIYADMMAKMALRRYELLLLAAGRALAQLCLQ